VTLQEHDVQPAGWAKSLTDLLSVPEASPTSHGIGNFLNKTLVIAEWEARKIIHDPTDIFVRMVQPTLWLLVFGQVMASIRGIAVGYQSYGDFLAPGILAQSVLFQAIFYGIAIIWERDLGITAKFLATPVPRGALILGKTLAAGVRSIPQAVIVYILALLIGVHINWNPLALLGVVVMIILCASCFSSLSMLIASLLRTRERVMGIGQVITMPLFFASNAIYDINRMPQWLQVIAQINPLSYQVGALRMLMVTGGSFDMARLSIDFGIVLVVTAVLVTLCARFYPKVVQ
jgi:ABC-2 type transport system permease protein